MNIRLDGKQIKLNGQLCVPWGNSYVKWVSRGGGVTLSRTCSSKGFTAEQNASFSRNSAFQGCQLGSCSYVLC